MSNLNTIVEQLSKLTVLEAADLVKLLEELSLTNGFSHQRHEYRTPWQR